ncbi:MAG: hypothetical protein ACXVYB_00190 [Arthrobacter sp.]
MTEQAEWEKERAAAVLKHLKRTPQDFEKLRLLTGLTRDALRESLYQLTVDGDADYEYNERGWPLGWRLPPRRRKLTRKEAIGVLMEAADSWSSELAEWIIPADDEDDGDDWENNMSTTANRREQMARIEEAIDLLKPKEKS